LDDLPGKIVAADDAREDVAEGSVALAVKLLQGIFLAIHLSVFDREPRWFLY